MNSLARIDLKIIASLVAESSRVLDIGSDNGDLLALLRKERNATGVGIELSQEGVAACLARGLNVIQGDAETELQDYPDAAFDYVVLSHTLQAMVKPAEVIEQMLRIGNAAIVSFPNFSFWRVRFYLLLWGRMPVSSLLPHNWFDTPNIHFCTIRDFVILTKERGWVIKRFVPLSRTKQRRLRGLSFSNWFAQQAIFVLQSKDKF